VTSSGLFGGIKNIGDGSGKQQRIFLKGGTERPPTLLDFAKVLLYSFPLEETARTFTEVLTFVHRRYDGL
jgi:hypothetical protein